jgi:putative molybdopterin biosynthesis protein
MNKKNALSTQDVADMLGVSKSTIYNMIKTGEIISYKVGRKVKFTEDSVNDFIRRSSANQAVQHTRADAAAEFSLVAETKAPGGFIICGQDLILDVLSNYMRSYGIPALRAYIGSYDSLMLLYKNKVNVASSHLWDSETDQYNVPYVKRLLPGVSAAVIHLTCRMQGLYVQKGNPKKIEGWEDFKRGDISMINREYGAGSRVLLDENLKLLGIAGSAIKGYFTEGLSHLALASAVSGGKADVAVGIEKIARQVDNIDFIPIKKERYDLVVKMEHMQSPEIQTMLSIIKSAAFKQEFSNIGGYDTAGMGKLVAKI